jgi:hypothetical protein
VIDAAECIDASSKELITRSRSENQDSTLSTIIFFVLTLPIQIRHFSLLHFLSLPSSSFDPNNIQPMGTFGEKDSSSEAIRV